MDVSTPPSLDLACPQAEADNDKYVHMFRGRGVDKTKYGHEGIMILYRYLLHYGLLLHVMSQYLCPFYLILQGLHEEGECQQLEFWAGKGANIRDLFCTTPKVLKVHESYFGNNKKY